MKYEMKIVKSELVEIEEKEVYRIEFRNISDGANKNSTYAFIFDKPLKVGNRATLILEGEIE